MSRYDTYGFESRDMDEARARVEAALGISMTRRDSSYWGEYWCAAEQSIRDFMLYENIVGKWRTSERYGVILLVGERNDMDEIASRLSGVCDLLASRVLPDETDDDED